MGTKPEGRHHRRRIAESSCRFYFRYGREIFPESRDRKKTGP
jgi:hypothetical protein